MGDADKADESLLPDWHVMDDPNWPVKGDPPFQIPPIRLLQQFADLSHLAYVYTKNIGTAAVPDFPIVTTKTANTVRMIRWILDSPPAPLYAHFGGFTVNIDRWQYAEAMENKFQYGARWSPARWVRRSTGRPPRQFFAQIRGAERAGVRILQSECHYPGDREPDLVLCRRAFLNFAGRSEHGRGVPHELRAAFQEDVDILAAQQMNMARRV